MPTLNRNHVEQMDIVIPPKEVQDEFHNAIEPLLFMRDALEQDSKCLSGLRDTLLPRLMTGDVAIGS